VTAEGSGVRLAPFACRSARQIERTLNRDFDGGTGTQPTYLSKRIECFLPETDYEPRIYDADLRQSKLRRRPYQVGAGNGSAHSAEFHKREKIGSENIFESNSEIVAQQLSKILIRRYMPTIAENGRVFVEGT